MYLRIRRVGGSSYMSYQTLYTVALSLGLRQGEAFGLRWKDVDRDGGV